MRLGGLRKAVSLMDLNFQFAALEPPEQVCRAPLQLVPLADVMGQRGAR